MLCTHSLIMLRKNSLIANNKQIILYVIDIDRSVNDGQRRTDMTHYVALSLLPDSALPGQHHLGWPAPYLVTSCDLSIGCSSGPHARS